jgi:predicted phosphodiesterase
MRVAIISDMHGNGVALEAALNDLATVDAEQVVCLGDAIQGGAQPAETVARLRELGCSVVMGNADAWLLSGVDTAEPASAELRQMRDWSLAQLSGADRAFIAGFVPTVEIPLGQAGTLLCFHGSPRSFDEIIFPDTPAEDVERMLGGTAALALAGGHTHLQQLRRLGTARFINPGSVGLAYDALAQTPLADPWAEYAVLTARDDGWLSVEFRRVPFDVDAYLRVVDQSGMPAAAAVHARYQR